MAIWSKGWQMNGSCKGLDVSQRGYVTNMATPSSLWVGDASKTNQVLLFHICKCSQDPGNISNDWAWLWKYIFRVLVLKFVSVKYCRRTGQKGKTFDGKHQPTQPWKETFLMPNNIFKNITASIFCNTKKITSVINFFRNTEPAHAFLWTRGSWI